MHPTVLGNYVLRSHRDQILSFENWYRDSNKNSRNPTRIAAVGFTRLSVEELFFLLFWLLFFGLFFSLGFGLCFFLLFFGLLLFWLFGRSAGWGWDFYAATRG